MPVLAAGRRTTLGNIDDSRVQITSYDALKAGLGALPIRTFKFTLEPSDLTAAATTEAVDISTDDEGRAFPANAYVIGASIDGQVAMTGGSVSALTVQIGDTADPNELLTATSVFTATGWAHAPGVYTPMTLEAAYAPEALVTATGANVDQVTAGRAVLYIYYVKPEDPTARS